MRDSKPIQRALLSVSDKTGLVELARGLIKAGVELIATGGTRDLLTENGIPSTPVEAISKTPEAFGGRMKTLSFPLLSGILFHRSRDLDEASKLGIQPIDLVVVNFYPFENYSIEFRGESRGGSRGELRDKNSKLDESLEQLIEKIDIGGPTLVRAAAKNAPEVSVLTDPEDYQSFLTELNSNSGRILEKTSRRLSHRAWLKVLNYDRAIAETLSPPELQNSLTAPSLAAVKLRYGENPHQKAWFTEFDSSPIEWIANSDEALTSNALSYNNFLDLSAAYRLMSELIELDPSRAHCVIVKHLSPCGVASVPIVSSNVSSNSQKDVSSNKISNKSTNDISPHDIFNASKIALDLAWAGDPVSSFGGVVVFSHSIDESVFSYFYTHFIDTLAAPGLSPSISGWQNLLSKRKGLKAVRIQSWEVSSQFSNYIEVGVPGGRLTQEVDAYQEEPLESKTKKPFPSEQTSLARFGIACVKSLKSNAVALVRTLPSLQGLHSQELQGQALHESWQLVGTGQGQPNRIEALEWLAIPRARRAIGKDSLRECLLVSDAFFPFADAVSVAAKADIRAIVQPGGSLKDSESVAAADSNDIAMAFTGRRHFKH